jgi:hypothetical protein
MSLNKSIFSDNRFWSCAKCDDDLSPNVEVFGQQILRNVDAILFKDNPISNTQLLRQIENRSCIDDHFMDVIRTNIRAANTNDQVAHILDDHLRFLSSGTIERQFPIDQDDDYNIIEARNVPEDDDEEDEFDDSYNLEDIIMDEYEFRSLYGNFRVEDDNEDEADDSDTVDEHR